MVDSDVIYDCADKDKLRFFSDIAVKPKSLEYLVKSKGELLKLLRKHINGSDISGEIDIYDDGKSSIAVPLEIEAIIVDNDEVMSEVMKLLRPGGGKGKNPQLFVDELPRNELGESDLF